VTLPLDICAALRRQLFLCTAVTPSDGLPRRCIDEGLSGLQCLEAGYMRDATAAHGGSTSGMSSGGGDGGDSGSEDDSGGGSRGDSEGSGQPTRQELVESAAARGSSDWLTDAAEAAHRHACMIFEREGITDTQGIDCTRFTSGGGSGDGNSRAGSRGGSSGGGGISSDGLDVDGSDGDGSYVPRRKPNLIGFDEDGWAMALCAKCAGRPETMVRSCRRATSLRQCQRDEQQTDQSICNLCSDDEVGNLLPETERPCSLYRGTCPGAVEKRIRGIVPPNLDIVGNHFVGGLRYCARRESFTTSRHYYTEDDIMKPGQRCINDVPMWTNWDMAKIRDHPRTIEDELGLACLQPDNEQTCPRARRCEDELLCHTDQPDWTDDAVLRRGAEDDAYNSNQGWGPSASAYLNPDEEHSYNVPPEYRYHLGCTSWAVMPRTDAAFWHFNNRRHFGAASYVPDVEWEPQINIES